jgi:uncharacterized protein YdeI (YjbR/CyaY-like superfamily)
METRHFKTADDFRAWLAGHHSTAAEIGVVLHRKDSGKAGMSWSEAVDVALCYGWIDSVARRLDDTSRVQRFTPRRPNSNWSLINIRKVGDLTARGLMTPAGLSAFARRTEARSGVYTYENPHLAKLDSRLEARLRAAGPGWRFFGEQSPAYRQTAIKWVMSAKREATRERRLGATLPGPFGRTLLDEFACVPSATPNVSRPGSRTPSMPASTTAKPSPWALSEPSSFAAMASRPPG